MELAEREHPLDRYIQFVEERFRVWERRQAGEPAPWTEDPIIQTGKFTNVFRAVDHGSQFLIKELLYSDQASATARDRLMRCFLYRYTNTPNAWEYFYQQHGRHPVMSDLQDGTLANDWVRFRAGGGKIFGNAYRMFVGAENKGMSRLDWVLSLTAESFAPDSPWSVSEQFFHSRTMTERLDVLQTIPRCAGFMSMQIVTDMGYGPDLQSDENEYIVPGPGAERGTHEIAPGEDPASVIHRITRLWEDRGTVLLEGTRPPSLMDVQNTFCEFGKRMRYYRNPASSRPYRPAHPGTKPEPFYPPHWGL